MGTDIHGVFQRRAGNQWHDIPSLYEQDRHYQLFAVLAGVRNGYGFAGVPTGEAVTPISEPRGLPIDFPVDDDSHHEAGKLLEIWMGDHSYSWLTGAEMLAWAETAPRIVKTGVLSREAYGDWDKTSPPKMYCGGVSGGGALVVQDNTFAKKAQPHWTHIQCTWTRDLREELADFFGEVARLVSEHGEIRFVFGFDS